MTAHIAMPTTALSLHIHHKRYAGRAPVLQNLSLEAANGEFVALVGPSGAGKTTLLNILCGLDRDFDGSVNLPPQARIGMVFQEPRLLPWLSVADNLRLVQPHLSAEQLRSALTSVGLPDCATRFPGQLSGGMQRRIALLRAFIFQPSVLLMDEPFQSLDAPTAQQLRTLLLALWQQSRATILFVTHSLPEALALADRILFLTPSPSQVALNYAVPTPRTHSLDSPATMALQQALLAQYPQLLQGVVGM